MDELDSLLDSAEADEATSKRSALDCHELGAEASVTKGSQALVHERAGKQRGAAEMGSMQARKEAAGMLASAVKPSSGDTAERHRGTLGCM